MENDLKSSLEERRAMFGRLLDERAGGFTSVSSLEKVLTCPLVQSRPLILPRANEDDPLNTYAILSDFPGMTPDNPEEK